MQLDLRYKCELKENVVLLYNNIADNCREAFNQMISEIGKSHKYNLDWWLEGPASRNTLVSPLFHYYVSFRLVVELTSSGQDINDIIVDSLALKRILKQFFKTRKSYVNVRYKSYLRLTLFRKFFKPIYKILRELYIWSLRLYLVNKSKRFKKPIPARPITLIDVYAIKGFISKDRYYNGLWKNLSAEQKQETFFVPHVVHMAPKHLKRAYLELRQSNRNFLIKEDYLKFTDILYSIMHLFRLKKLALPPFTVHNIDFSSLIREELLSLRGYSAAVVSFLNYRFAMRLKENNIKLRLVIDWFENQVFDKGWNAGFNKFYPQVNSIGYRGYVPGLNYLNSFPSDSEIDNQMLPKQIAVIGEGFKKSLLKLTPRLDVICAPAFRFQHLWTTNQNTPDGNHFTILIALSIMWRESVKILKLVNSSLYQNKINNLIVWVKPHPTMPSEKLKKYFGKEWPDNFEFVEGDSGDLIAKSNILISGMSSICLETMSMGIPVIMIDNLSGLSYNPIPNEIEQDLWKLCRTSREIKSSILHFQKMSISDYDILKQKGDKIKKTFFEPVTHENVLKLLHYN